MAEPSQILEALKQSIERMNAIREKAIKVAELNEKFMVMNEDRFNYERVFGRLRGLPVFKVGLSGWVVGEIMVYVSGICSYDQIYLVNRPAKLNLKIELDPVFDDWKLRFGLGIEDDVNQSFHDL